MVRYALLNNTNTRPIAVTVRCLRKDQARISLTVPIAWAGAILYGLDAFRSLADGIRTESIKAEIGRKTKEQSSMWQRRLRAIGRAYCQLRESGMLHRAAVKCLVEDYRWKDLGWSFSDFNHHVPTANNWQDLRAYLDDQVKRERVKAITETPPRLQLA